MLAHASDAAGDGRENGGLLFWGADFVAEDPQFQNIHADGLGSIVAMTDAAGNVTSRRQYDAWGNLEVGADQPGYAFTGREWDPETGLYYYRARYYDPKIGRFISEDPIGFAGGGNFYAYVDGRPVSMTDPTGLAKVGDVVMFDWGLGYPEHTALVTAVDDKGTPTRAFGGWTNNSTPRFQDLDLVKAGYVPNIFGTGDMEGLTARTLAEVMSIWSTGHEIVVDANGHWLARGSVCIDVATARDGLGGKTLRDAMAADFAKNRASYNKLFAEAPSIPSIYRQNLALMQFFKNTGRFTKY